MKPLICTAEDEYVRILQLERRQAIWKVSLSDGIEVVMDDGRPGVEPYQAWLRLATHCEQESVSITNLWLQFRTNVQRPLPCGAAAYFFGKTILGSLNSNQTIHFYNIGYLQSGKLVVQTWSVPELILVKQEERDPAQAGQRLIWGLTDGKQ